MNKRNVVICYLVMSLVAAGMLLFLSWAGSSQGYELSFQNKVLVGAAFMASCIFGIEQSIRPCGLGGKGHEARVPEAGGRKRGRAGHHPGCEGFESHVIVIKNKSYCSGCLGLGLGSGISLVIMGAFLFVPAISPSSGFALAVLGLSLVALGLAETAIHSRWQELHVLANALLVFGFLLVTIGVSGASGSVGYGLLTVLVAFLWLDTRIRISDWKHAEICRKCCQDCKSY